MNYITATRHGARVFEREGIVILVTPFGVAFSVDAGHDGQPVLCALARCSLDPDAWTLATLFRTAQEIAL